MMSALAATRDETSSAQSRWARMPVRDRVRFLRVLRHLIAENADALAAAAAAVNDRPLPEKLVSEVLPLADACRWLERNAARVLAPRRHGRRCRPLWLVGATFEVQRQPFGTVLVIGPGNYPLFLPAVQTLHALVAGNAVRLKPAPGTSAVALAFARLAIEAGLDPALLEILDDTAEAARTAIATGVDKVVFTGSSENGRAVLAQLAETNTPSVMELFGEDAVIVLPDADLDLVARALRFGTTLNAGQTCIAPRRLIAVGTVPERLRQLSVPEGQSKLAGGVSHRNADETRMRPGRGAGNPPADSAVPPGRNRYGDVIRWLTPPANLRRPSGTNRDAGVAASEEIRDDRIGSLSMVAVADEAAAIALVNSADFALGCSIFTRDLAKARDLAAQIRTGFVTINDLIVPTADPRLPFGGVRASGFGTTRGAEGLLEMTYPHVVVLRRGQSRPHFDAPGPDDARLFSTYIRAAHGRPRLAALRDFVRALFQQAKSRTS